MVALTSKEILLELKRFGITDPSDLKSYLKKYKRYYTKHHSLAEQGICTALSKILNCLWYRAKQMAPQTALHP